MSEPDAIRVLQVAEVQRYQKLVEYGSDLDDDAKEDSGPMIRYQAMVGMYLGISGPQSVWAQVPSDPERIPLVRLAKVVLELADSALGLGGALRQTNPERYELEWTEKQ